MLPEIHASPRQLISLLALFVGVLIGCETPKAKQQDEPAVEQVRIGWTNFVSSEWKFSVRFPCTPIFKKSDYSKPNIGTIPVGQWTAAFDGVAGSIACSVTCGQYPKVLTDETRAIGLALARTNAVRNGKLISDTAVEHKGLNGREWTIETADGKFLVVVRTFHVEQFSYILVSLLDTQYLAADQPEDIRDAALNTRERFFDSFEVLK